MAQILNDPAEFGKVVLAGKIRDQSGLQGKIRDHMIQESDLDGCVND